MTATNDVAVFHSRCSRRQGDLKHRKDDGATVDEGQGRCTRHITSNCQGDIKQKTRDVHPRARVKPPNTDRNVHD